MDTTQIRYSRGQSDVCSLVCMMWSRAVNYFIVVGNEPQLYLLHAFRGQTNPMIVIVLIKEQCLLKMNLLGYSPCLQIGYWYTLSGISTHF